MDTLGLALIVAGAAFLCSSLIFLLPTERKVSSSRRSTEENLDEIESYLQRMREERGDLR